MWHTCEIEQEKKRNKDSDEGRDAEKTGLKMNVLKERLRKKKDWDVLDRCKVEIAKTEEYPRVGERNGQVIRSGGRFPAVSQLSCHVVAP